jgi:hypothetical protein
MNYRFAIVRFKDVIQDSSWDGPDKVNCPTVTSVGWLVDSDDPIKIAGTLDDGGNPCAILAISRGCVLELPEVSIYEHREKRTNIS